MSTTFNAVEATVSEWEQYLLSESNHKRVYTSIPPLPSPFEKVVRSFIKSDESFEKRRNALNNAVQAILNRWNEIVAIGEKIDFTTINPIPVLLQIVRTSDQDSQMSLIKIVQRLWFEPPDKQAITRRGVRLVLTGLGKEVPVSDDYLSSIYLQHFDLYSFDVIKILLERGSTERASQLFTQKVAEYGDFDPISLNNLVASGLPFETAKLWLDQSVNAKPGYEGHYDDALRRWKEIAVH